MTEYKVIEKRFYIKNELGQRQIISEKINKKNVHSYYLYTKKKSIRTTAEYHANLVSKITYSKIENKIIKKSERDKEKEFEEYEYMIGFDYTTPHINSSKGQIFKGNHGKHDFKTEFRISSPIKLSQNELKQLILQKFADYSNVLKNDESYEIKSDNEDSPNKTQYRPSINVEMTEKITR
jgi:hypothetical protein